MMQLMKATLLAVALAAVVKGLDVLPCDQLTTMAPGERVVVQSPNFPQPYDDQYRYFCFTLFKHLTFYLTCSCLNWIYDCFSFSIEIMFNNSFVCYQLVVQHSSPSSGASIQVSVWDQLPKRVIHIPRIHLPWVSVGGLHRLFKRSSCSHVQRLPWRVSAWKLSSVIIMFLSLNNVFFLNNEYTNHCSWNKALKSLVRETEIGCNKKSFLFISCSLNLK